MPHSGGGGSHGGGSHGGSHGGSSHRTSHHYFYGARRYRRHYRDGRPDEYFYSNGRPQKTSLFSIIFIILFGVVFSGLTFLGTSSSIPKKLDEEYRRPNERVIDNIGIIEDTDELEDALEEFNDVTGICPIVYTMYVEDYVDRYADLESFAYDKYVDSYLDEQHYLVVYAIPEDQVEPFMSRQLEVPDFEFEVMQGDDTDAIMTEGRDRFFVHNVQSNLDNGCEVGETFTVIFEEMSDDCAHDLKSPARFKVLLPFLIVIGFFILPIVFMIKAYINEVAVAKDASGNVVGYGISATTMDGYDGEISMAVGMDTDGKILGVSFTVLNETAGMGMLVNEESWRGQFQDKQVDSFVLLKQGGSTADNEIDSVSGASTTSGAVVNAVNAAIDFYKNYLAQ